MMEMMEVMTDQGMSPCNKAFRLCFLVDVAWTLSIFGILSRTAKMTIAMQKKKELLI